MSKKHKEELEAMALESEAFLNAINQSMASGKVENFDLTEETSSFDGDEAFEKMIIAKMKQKKTVEEPIVPATEEEEPVDVEEDDTTDEEDFKEALEEAFEEQSNEMEEEEPAEEAPEEDLKDALTESLEKEAEKQAVVPVKEETKMREIFITETREFGVRTLLISDGVNTVTVNLASVNKDVKAPSMDIEDIAQATLLEVIQEFYPSAVYTNDEFAKKFRGIKDFNPDLFSFYQAGDMILAYHLSAKSVNTFYSFISRADVEGKAANALQVLAVKCDNAASFLSDKRVVEGLVKEDKKDEYWNVLHSHEETVEEEDADGIFEAILPYGIVNSEYVQERYDCAVGEEEEEAVLPSKYLDGKKEETAEEESTDEEEEDDSDDDDSMDDLFEDDDEEDEDDEEEEAPVEKKEDPEEKSDPNEIKHPKKQSSDASMVVKVEN